MGGILLLITSSNHSLKSAFDGFLNKKRSVNDGDLHPANVFVHRQLRMQSTRKHFAFVLLL